MRMPPKSTQPDTLVPYPTLFRSARHVRRKGLHCHRHQRADARHGLQSFRYRRGGCEFRDPCGLRINPAVEHSKLLEHREALDRKSVVEGKSVLVRVDLGGRRIINNKNKHYKHITHFNYTIHHKNNTLEII